MDPLNIDILISRVVDKEARPADWAALEIAATRDPAVWRDLAAALRTNQEFGAEFERQVAVADRVELDEDELADAVTRRHTRTFSERWRSMSAWGGWIAAALLVAFVSRANMGGGAAEVGNTASLGLNPGEYLSRYLNSGKQEGTVVGEMPRKLLLDTAPAEDGGVYVLYVRQIVERVKVDDIYRISVDELGNPAPVKLPAETWVAPASGPPM